MRKVEPEVYLIAESRINLESLRAALLSTGGDVAGRKWLNQKLGLDEEFRGDDESAFGIVHSKLKGELLTEVAGRYCYKSFDVSLNPNLTKIRQDSGDYLDNTLLKGDGSIFEHASCTFAFVNISRVLTHELVRHRVGVAISQESLRYVKPTSLGLWLPEETPPAVRQKLEEAVMNDEERYAELEKMIDVSDQPFDVKKKVTSLLRRMLPQGMATNMVWTANHRTLRHVLKMRTAPAAEVEIRVLFDKVGTILKERYPLIYQDFTRSVLEDGTGCWTPEYEKV